MFKKYVSNTAIGTGTNFILTSDRPMHLRARGYFRPELCGDFNWSFYYVNSVNSTFSDGAVAFRNRSGGELRILSAAVADGGAVNGAEVVPGELAFTPVTFDGSTSRTVQPDEAFWSDPVSLSLPDGHYLAFEWELEGCAIPCTPDSRAAVFVDYGDGFRTEDSCSCPMPALLGCDRPYKKRIAFVGDSITQGCGTRKNYYENWVHKLAERLQPDYSVWNLGLGYARGSDLATCGSWLKKATNSDIVVMTLGVNDIYHGEYGAGRYSTAGELVAWLETSLAALKAAGVEVILSTIPPFDFTDGKLREWRAANLALRGLAKLHGCRVFDFDASLDVGQVEGRSVHGGHPDAIGCELAAAAFERSFRTTNGWRL